MLRTILRGAFPLALAAGGAMAQGVPVPKPPHPCAFDEELGPVTSQVRACSQWRYDRAAAHLATILADVRRLFDHDAEAPEDERERQALRRRAFEESETAWRAYVAAACEAAYYEVFPGSFAGIHRLDCLERLSRERIAGLTRTYFPDQ
jgi:uncharacterized protein YecT (DUF1311 family)